MLKIQVLSVLGFVFFGLVVAHPHPYPKWAIPKTKEGELPKPLSYHIHCQFVNGDSQVVAEALQFRDKFIEHFNLTHTTHCMDTFAETRLCMFDLELKPDLDSPFVSGNWAVFVPIEWFSTTVQWSMQNRGNMTVFVHPNTGAELSDHKVWALWGGPQWPINFSAFTNQTLF